MHLLHPFTPEARTPDNSQPTAGRMALSLLVAASAAALSSSPFVFWSAITHPISLWCEGSAMLSEVIFADWGLPATAPNGSAVSCDHFAANATCTSAVAGMTGAMLEEDVVVIEHGSGDFSRTLRLKVDESAGDVPCQKGDPVGPSAGLLHPAPVCAPDSCASSTGVHTAQCSGAECSEPLQAAFDSCCPFIIVPPRSDGSPWVTAKTLWLRSNSTVTFRPGVTILAMRGQFKTKGAPLFLARNISNLTVSGYGAVWQMWKHDYDRPSLGYCHSEARPGLWMGPGCDGCRVFGLIITMTGGDGIEVVESTNVHLKDVKLDNNYRQGLSVVGVENMLVEDALFSNTGQGAGTAPMDGVDVEPDDARQATVNLTFRNCQAINNVGGGYSIAMKKNDATTYAAPKKPMSIVFDNCSVDVTGGQTDPADRCSHGNGYSVIGPKIGARGSIVIRNALVQHTARAGIQLYNVATDGPSVLFENVELRNVATTTDCCAIWSNKGCANPNCKGNCSTTLPISPIMVRWIPSVGWGSGGGSFNNVTIVDTNKDRSAVFLDPAGSCQLGWGLSLCLLHWKKGQQKLNGNITVITGNHGARACQLDGSGGCERMGTAATGHAIGCNLTAPQMPPSLHIRCAADIKTDDDAVPVESLMLRQPRRGAKSANLWLSTAHCCGEPGCGDLFDTAYGLSHGLNGSYFDVLRPWAASLDGLLIDCGHRLSTTGTLTLPNATQQRRLSRTVSEFAELNISVMPMIFADYDRADLGLDALSNSASVQAAFIAATVHDTTTHGYAGWNIDWEPCTGKTKARECGVLSPARKWPLIPEILGQLHDAIAHAAPGTRTPDGRPFPSISAAGYACDRTEKAPTFSHCPYGNVSLLNATDFRNTPLSLQSMGTYSSWPASFDLFLAAGVANPGVANFGGE